MNMDTAKLIDLNPDLKVDGELSHHNSTGGFGDHTTKEMVDMARNYYKNVDTEGIFKISCYKQLENSSTSVLPILQWLLKIKSYGEVDDNLQAWLATLWLHIRYQNEDGWRTYHVKSVFKLVFTKCKLYIN